MPLFRGCKKGMHFQSYRVIVSILRRRFQVSRHVSANGKNGKNQWICSWGPISEPAVEMGINLISSCHVETVVLLSRKAD